MEEWFLIANPIAGGHKCRKYLSEIIGLLNKYGINHRPNLTMHKGHAITLAREASRSGYRRFISVGGDGTANEVVNGIASQLSKYENIMDHTLAVIPVGTGNDWCRSAGLSADHESNIRTIKEGRSTFQDLCRASFISQDGKRKEKFFINVAGTGYDAEVLFKTEKMKSNGKRGSHVYFYNIFTSLFSYKPSMTSVIIDESEVIKEKALSINIGIGRYNGGGLMQVPHASLNDGNIAITFIGDIGKLGIILNLPRLKNGNFQKVKKVQLLKGKKIEIISQKKMLFEADGEALGMAPLSFEVLPGSLRIITNQNQSGLTAS